MLEALGAHDLPRPLVTQLVRQHLASLRRAGNVPSFEEIVRDLQADIIRLGQTRLQAVINGTGIVLHTNFGRAPLSASAVRRVADIAAGYSNLEYDIASGGRGTRAAYLERCLALACGSESAAVVNNGAAALVLIVRHFTKKKREVIISRGELVQIGGGFRVGEMLEASGARLREVGATNKTTLDDYASAIGPDTALILRVHQSNFFIGGFAELPPNDAIAVACPESARAVRGRSRERRAFRHRNARSERARADPGGNAQAGRGVGLLQWRQAPGRTAGRDHCRQNAAGLRIEARADFSRLALRQDGSCRARSDGRSPPRQSDAEVPTLHLLSVPNGKLRARGEALLERLRTLPLSARLVESKTEIGGGALPRSVIRSVALEVSSAGLSPNEQAARLRHGSPALIGYVAHGRFKLDLRTIFPEQDELVVAALSACLTNQAGVKHFILATAGHVDHGKTALVKALTGINTDRLPEEKARGISIDLGFAHLALPGFSFGVIDVPGHQDFIRNMIAGLGSIDLALLVVAADDGWMPQTEEHFQILHYLGVRHGVVAITKCDLGDPARIAADVRERLRGTSLGLMPIVETSARAATGLDELKQTLVRVSASIPPPRDRGKPRLFVDRVFTVRGSGTVVTGTLTGGRLFRGRTISMQPQNLRARIRAIQSHNQSLEIALPGTRTALNLSDLRPGEIPRGSVLTTIDSGGIEPRDRRNGRAICPGLFAFASAQERFRGRGALRECAFRGPDSLARST